MATKEGKKHLKAIHIKLQGHGTENEGFSIQHEMGAPDSEYNSEMRDMGAAVHHSHIMHHLHEHLSKHGSSEEEHEHDDGCPHCGTSGEDEELEKDKKKTGTHMAKEEKHSSKHPGFKAVQNKIAAKEGLSRKAAGAILAARSRGASKAAHKANPRLNRVKG